MGNGGVGVPIERFPNPPQNSLKWHLTLHWLVLRWVACEISNHFMLN
jgi:hypothetical protein